MTIEKIEAIQSFMESVEQEILRQYFNEITREKLFLESDPATIEHILYEAKANKIADPFRKIILMYKDVKAVTNHGEKLREKIKQYKLDLFQYDSRRYHTLIKLRAYGLLYRACRNHKECGSSTFMIYRFCDTCIDQLANCELPPHTTRVRLVLSLDFDGCLSKACQVDSRTLIETDYLVQALKEISAKFAWVNLMVGSNRQSIRDEVYAVFKNKKRCFSFMEILARELNLSLDHFLMADIHHDFPDGQSFKQGVAYTKFELETNHHTNSYAWDEEKISLLYTQIHRASCLHSGDHLAFHFYDDRDDILSALNNFFSQNPILIPNNVTLVLRKYNGKNFIKTIGTITGSGLADKDYRAVYIRFRRLANPYRYETVVNHLLASAKRRLRQNVVAKS